MGFGLVRGFPSEKEIRKASLKTHERNNSYFQILCNRKSKKLKVIECVSEDCGRNDNDKYFTVSFHKGHISYRKLRQYIEAGIWIQENL